MRAVLPLRGLGFWGGMVLCIPQALATRSRAIRLAIAPGPQSGLCAPARQTSPRPGSQREAEAPGLQLLGVGDSIIAGVGVQDSRNALTSALATRVASALGASVAWRARGRNGADAAAVRKRLLAVESGPPADLVVVSVGVNDLIGLATGHRWRRELAALLATLRRHSPDALIALLGLPPLDRFPSLPPRLAGVLGGRARAFDDLLAAAALEHAGTVHVPLTFGPGPGQFCSDGFHPDVAGHGMLADAVSSALLAHWRTWRVGRGLRP